MAVRWWRRTRAQARQNLPAGFTAQPSATPGPNGFPTVQFLEGNIPAALGLPNPAVVAFNQNREAPVPTGGDVFQREWIDACKGKNNKVVHGTSSKTHCDFDYSGSMIEQMLLGLVAHRVGKKSIRPGHRPRYQFIRGQRLSEAPVPFRLDA